MISFLKQIARFKKQPEFVSPEEFKEQKEKFESKKRELISAIRQATEDKDLLRKDILLKELSENERKFEAIRKGLWGDIKKHPNRLSAVEEATHTTEK